MSEIRPFDFKRVSGVSGEFAVPTPSALEVLVIEPHVFYRACIVQSLCANDAITVTSAASATAWLETGARGNFSVALVCADHLTKERLLDDIALIAKEVPSAGIVVLSGSKDVDTVVSALSSGARGFLPADTTMDVLIRALGLVTSGGTYVPASSLLAACDNRGSAPKPASQSHGLFTSRQLAVIDALRKGKANKTIAYELNMCESTVKVHVRNIMKRLKAKNRTQVAYIASELFGSGH